MALSRFAMVAAMTYPISGARTKRHATSKVTSVVQSNKEETFHLRALREDGTASCQIVEAAWGQQHRLAKNDVFAAEPRFEWTDEEGGHSLTRVLDFWGPTEEGVRERAQMACRGGLEAAIPPAAPRNDQTEVRCLICSGDSSNRIDVVLMGDGYQLGERERFFSDMQRLTDDMFADVTFRSYLPVFNIWAIHAPSVDSGIGYFGRAKNTPFGLYKNGEQHRAVLPTSRGRANARSICQLAGGCDFPSLIGNDEFYGGLGGEFTIGTRSLTTGTIVLRHEMGHNFVNVGEEYDDGQVYRGVNSDSTTFIGSRPRDPIKWQHWLTEPDKPVVEQRMQTVLAEYPWTDLEDNVEQSYSFSTDGTFPIWKMMFTVSGFPDAGSLKIYLDDVELPWSPRVMDGAENADGTTVDRLFYYYDSDSNGGGFSRGTHRLRFVAPVPRPNGAPTRQLCSVTIWEYGADGEFNHSPGYVGAYPVWNWRGTKSYRPTDNLCLMRDMESTNFCPVCKEGMWVQFFNRMSPIDGVDVTSSGSDRTVDLQLVPLAQLRERPVPGLTESFTVVWKKGGQVQSNLADKLTFSGSVGSLAGSWTVQVTYNTVEVRKDSNNVLTDSKSFMIS